MKGRGDQIAFCPPPPIPSPIEGGGDYNYGLISKIDPDFSSPGFFYIAQTGVVKL
jgi:hypothetical protein